MLFFFGLFVGCAIGILVMAMMTISADNAEFDAQHLKTEGEE